MLYNSTVIIVLVAEGAWMLIKMICSSSIFMGYVGWIHLYIILAAISLLSVRFLKESWPYINHTLSVEQRNIFTSIISE